MSADRTLLQQQITRFEALIAAEEYEKACQECVVIHQHLVVFQRQGLTAEVAEDIKTLKALFDVKIEDLKKKLQQIQITVASIDQFRSNKVSDAYQKNNY